MTMTKIDTEQHQRDNLKKLLEAGNMRLFVVTSKAGYNTNGIWTTTAKYWIIDGNGETAHVSSHVNALLKGRYNKKSWTCTIPHRLDTIISYIGEQLFYGHRSAISYKELN